MSSSSTTSTPCRRGAAVAWIEAAQSAIGAGSIGVVAFDPARLVDALGGAGEARRRFDKWLQVVVNLPGRAERRRGAPHRAAARDGRTAPRPARSGDRGRAIEPLTAAETGLLTALAPLAAGSPRAAKRFLNAYRLARCSDAPRPAVALMQAVAFADDETQAAMRAG